MTRPERINQLRHHLQRIRHHQREAEAHLTALSILEAAIPGPEPSEAEQRPVSRPSGVAEVASVYRAGGWPYLGREPVVPKGD